MQESLRRLQPMWLAVAAFSLLMMPRAQAGTETVLHTFTNGRDGSNPYAGMIQDSAGNFYGTTTAGANGGVVFEMVHNANGAWTEKVLHTFSSRSQGSGPSSKLVFDSAGNLYGTTFGGGINLGYGVVFELSPTASGIWTYRVLYSFTGGGDGGNPNGLVLDANGNLWGTTSGGTVFGSIFEMVPGSGGAWSFQLRWIFEGNNEGTYPAGNLAFDGHNHFYGMTMNGGTYGYGTIYRFATVSGTSYVQPEPLHAFTGGLDGANPASGLIFDASGNLYGTTWMRGADGFGTAFQFTRNSSGGRNLVTLHAFAGGNDGANPSSSLTFDSSGNLYGTTVNGGAFTFGTIFKLSAGSSGGWTARTIHAFTGGRDGASPFADLIVDSTGHLYGTAAGGGALQGYIGYGVVFEFTP